MKPTPMLLIAIVLALASATASARGPASSSPSPASAPSTEADVLWYDKAPPGWGGVVTNMKLLAPGIGWAERAGRLYRTTDNGANWKDITPPLDTDERLEGIYFLDPSKGWITINHDEPPSGAPKFDLVSTTDGGTTWSRMTVSLPPNDYGISVPDGFDLRGGGGRLVFADPLHGWMSVWFTGQSMNSWSSFLLQTSDGGRTWKLAHDAPGLRNPEMLLVTPSEGWLFGDEFDGSRRLYVTRDGARSWHEVAPKLAGLQDNQVMGLPTIEDTKLGFLQVDGTTSPGQGIVTTELMATSDAGRTWKPDRAVANIDEVAAQQYGSATVVGSEWIFAASSDHAPVLTKVGPAARIDAGTVTTAARPHYKYGGQISFATPTQGWIVVGDGYLKSTTDGGATWTDITPGSKPHIIHPQNEPPQ